MPTIVTQSQGRIQVPKKREREGDRPGMSNYVSVKVSGWVKYRKNGEIHHIPPAEVVRIEETDPDEKVGHNGEPTGTYESLVSYQNPHGSI